MSTVKILAAVVGVVVLWRILRGSTESQSDLSHTTEGDIPELLRAGRKIDAIKLYRRLHAADLKDAKDAIDRLEAQLRPRS